MKTVYSILLSFLSVVSICAQDTMVYKKVLSGHSGPVEAVSFSNDGHYFASGGWDNSVRLYSIDSTQQFEYLRTLSGHHAAVICVAISPDNRYVATSSKDYTFSVYELETGKLRFTSRDHKKAVTQVFFDPSSQFLITASEDGTARVYRVQDLEQVSPKSLELKYDSKINGAQLSPRKGKFLIATDDSKAVEIDINGKISARFAGHTARVGCLDVSHNRKILATGSDDKTIKLWDIKTRKLRYTLEGHGWKVTSVHFSADDRYLISSCNNGEVKIWDVKLGNEVSDLPKLGTNARQAMFSPDMKRIAVATFQSGSKFGPIIYQTPYEKQSRKKKSKKRPNKK